MVAEIEASGLRAGLSLDGLTVNSRRLNTGLRVLCFHRVQLKEAGRCQFCERSANGRRSHQLTQCGFHIGIKGNQQAA